MKIKEKCKMRIGKKKIYNIDEVVKVIGKFDEKINKQMEKATRYEAEIESLTQRLNEAIEKDIMEGDNEAVITDLGARIANTHTLLDISLESIDRIKTLRAERLKEILPATKKQINEDRHTFEDTVEKEIFTKLSEIRKEQEKLLLTLALARGQAITETTAYNTLCEDCELAEYTVNLSQESFHNNLQMAHSRFPELGVPVLSISHITTLEEKMTRDRANANAVYNRGKDADQVEQIPDVIKKEDIDLEGFLKGLKVNE
jgi:hypothetical protein